MIKLWDGWAIDADGYQLILGQPTEQSIKGKSFTSMSSATYHPTIGNALVAFYRMKLRECISQSELTLSQSIREASRIEERIRSLMAEPNFKEADQ